MISIADFLISVNSAAAPPPPVAIETIVPVLPTPAADLRLVSVYEKKKEDF